MRQNDVERVHDGIRVSTGVVMEDSSLLLISRAQDLMIKDNIENQQRIIRNIMLQVIPETAKISSPQIIEQLAQALTYENYKLGDIVIESGNSGDDLFILVDGECEISKKIVFKMKQRKPAFLDQSVDKLQQQPLIELDKKIKKIRKLAILQDVILISPLVRENNLKKQKKIVNRGLYIKVSSTQSLDLFGSEILFERDHQSILFKMFKNVQEKIKPEKQISSSQIKNIVKNWVTNPYSNTPSPYIYRIKVTSQKARCLRLHKSDFLMRFPKESVEQTQINYLIKLFQRFIVREYQEENILEQMEEQDKKAWLVPGKEFICQKNETLYIKGLYTDYLLGKSDNPSISRTPDRLLDSSRIQNSSLPYIKSHQSGDQKEPISERHKTYRQFRLPNTFDFGKQSLRTVEMNIQNELTNRGLLEKPKKLIRKDLVFDLQRGLKDKILSQKQDDVLSCSNFTSLINIHHSIKSSNPVPYQVNSYSAQNRSDSQRILKKPQNAQLNIKFLNQQIYMIKKKLKKLSGQDKIPEQSQDQIN